jgi:hypothetical protein
MVRFWKVEVTLKKIVWYMVKKWRESLYTPDMCPKEIKAKSGS